MTQSFGHLFFGILASIVTLALVTVICIYPVSEPIKVLAVALAPVGPILISVWEGK